MFDIYTWILVGVISASVVTGVIVGLVVEIYIGFLMLIASFGGVLALVFALITRGALKQGIATWHFFQLSTTLSMVGGAIAGCASMTPYKLAVIFSGSGFILAALHVLVIGVIHSLSKSKCGFLSRCRGTKPPDEETPTEVPVQD